MASGIHSVRQAFSPTQTTFLVSWAMYLGTCGQDNAGQRASASSKKAYNRSDASQSLSKRRHSSSAYEFFEDQLGGDNSS
ncbi:hypothetical protein V5799_012868 [Amblyomma americanum]|uniref:Uncharacterized protein n=1 Tax=Amblyomma americanum TaxID=6943 RepID=A0AAQ4E7F5_AMBAM